MLNESPFFDPESGEQYDTIVVDKFSFLLPCKAFSINYTISKGYDLALTYEFVLRFLKINGLTKVDVLRQYFGFSSTEIATELRKLINDGYIEKNVQTNAVRLTRQGEELFVEDKPEIIKTENVIDKFFVELIGYNLVRSQKSPYINAFIDLKMTQAEAQAAANSKKKAKGSFKNGYYQFIETKSEREAGYRSILRKIDNITTLNSFPAELPANLELKMSPTLSLELQLPRLNEFKDPSKIFRVIKRAASSILSDKNNISKSNLPNFVDLIANENLVSGYISSDHRFLLSGYLRDVFINQTRQYEPPGTKPIIGSPLIGQNFQNIITLIKAAKPADDPDEKSDLLWLRPSYPFWGRSKESLENINATKRELQEDGGRFVLLTDKKNAGKKGWDAKKRYKYYFDSIIEIDRIPELENIEIILMPQKFVCSIYYHAIRDSLYRIPFGFISTNQDILDNIQNRLDIYLKGRIVVDILDYKNSFRSAKLEDDVLKLLRGNHQKTQNRKQVVIIKNKEDG